eukprot:CAMPEP_0172492608 /NCGR_PEP_ID=MMETSP1066-20121228/23817_1 /TAXON_ID=671091 /ORGANISM="Coscinodiscus wailesii, Strain CCMP2513" /LENGTH=379 /DNA_ID=CAMNT_0013262331 /DNA_START=42 /DNA_END=1181 /DNA_ORIENTATION=+
MRALGIVAVAALPLTSAWSLPTPTSKYVTGNVNPKRRRYQSTRHLSNEAFPTQISNENAALANPPSSHPLDRILNTVLSAAPSAITITAATMATFALNNYFLKLGPVLSSSVIGLLSAIVLPPKLALAALCGSFAGMAKTAVIPGVAPSAALGFICALTMSLFDKKSWLVGVGGRLGFIAQCACTLQFIVFSLFVAPSSNAALLGPFPPVTGLIKSFPQIALFTAVGAFGMQYWKRIMSGASARLSSPVAAVGVTGAVAAITLPPAAAGPAFCGSFVAMASPAKVPDRRGLLLASVFAALAQQSLAGALLGGWGGKLGTAALMGVLAYTYVDGVFGAKDDEESGVEEPEVKMKDVGKVEKRVEVPVEEPKKKLTKKLTG